MRINTLSYVMRNSSRRDWFLVKAWGKTGAVIFLGKTKIHVSKDLLGCKVKLRVEVIQYKKSERSLRV